jgi:hypothetical protein
MKITQEVISDLLPLYFSGEASEDTRKLIDTYFEQNPEFAEKAKATQEQLITNEIPIKLTKEDEMESLNKTKKRIKLQHFLIGFAIFFTIAPFSFAHFDGKSYWLLTDSPMTALIYGSIGILFWISYFVMRYKNRISGL